MKGADDLDYATRREAESRGREIATRHMVDVANEGVSQQAADAIAELLDKAGLRLDAADEVAIKTIIGMAVANNGRYVVERERERILRGLGDVGARLSSGELAVIGRPSSGWWFG